MPVIGRADGLLQIRPVIQGPRPGAQRGPLTGPRPTDRGKYGPKVHLIVDLNGPPISVAFRVAMTHGALALQPLAQ